MTKQDFLAQLKKGLSSLPQDDASELLNFYAEMIEDRIDEGLSEEEAVSAAGSLESIISQASASAPFSADDSDKKKTKRKLSVTEITLLVLGSPIWLSLAVAACAILLSLYLSLWAIIISLWSIFGALISCALGGVVAGVILICIGNCAGSLAMLGIGIASAGFSILAFWGCKAATKATILLTKKFANWIKNRFFAKEVA